jgi:hypothetical protein
VTGGPYENDERFRAVFAAAPAEVIHARVLPARS